jgi:hypothetical protein
MTKRLTHIFILLLLTSPATAQFKLLGTADYMQSGCIQLTPDNQYQEGIAYSQDKLDLSEYFEIQFDVYLGNKDEEGADGIAFVIHNDPRGFRAYGSFGEGIGYKYIAPSVAIEFDTYQNPWYNDPYSDHVAYLENGASFHENYWNGEQENLNLEDDRLHDFRFSWNPENQQIVVTLDGNIVYKGNRNLINDIFEGSTDVIWGFTASTGRKYNLQYFCFRRLALLQLNNQKKLTD